MIIELEKSRKPAAPQISQKVKTMPTDLPPALHRLLFSKFKLYLLTFNISFIHKLGPLVSL